MVENWTGILVTVGVNSHRQWIKDISVQLQVGKYVSENIYYIPDFSVMLFQGDSQKAGMRGVWNLNGLQKALDSIETLFFRPTIIEEYSLMIYSSPSVIMLCWKGQAYPQLLSKPHVPAPPLQ